MPFQRPTLQELRDRAINDFDSRLQGTDARLRRSNTAVMSAIDAGLAHLLYGYLEYISRQILPDTAEEEYLDRHAAIWKEPRKEATASSGDITFTGANGSVIDAATEVQRSDGRIFTTDEAAVIAAGAATVAVTAAEAGADGDTASGSVLSLVSPVSGVNSSATVATGGLTGGADREEDVDLRPRVLSAIRLPPHGGAFFDYITWALEVPEVTRAWCYPLMNGDGTVGVTFVCDNQEGSIIPDAAKVAEVAAYIDYRRPVTADVTVAAPTSRTLNLTITDIDPDNDLVKAAVQAELEDLISREASPGGYLSSNGAAGGTIPLSHFREAISIAAGEWDHTLTSPSADDVSATGEIAVMGTITWA